MRRSVVRSAAVVLCLAWSVRTLGCDRAPAATKGAFQDTDGDGLSDTDEIVVHGTSPLLADTDGDGMSDYDEIVSHAFDAKSAPLAFNPRVADVPVLDVRIASPPLLTIRFTETNGEIWTYETTTTFEEGFSVSTSATEEVSFANTVGASDTVSREVSAEFQDEPLAAPDEDDAGARAPGDAGARDGGTKKKQPRRRAEAPSTIVFQRRPLIFDPGGPDVLTLTSSISSTVDWSATDTLTLSFTAEQTREFRRAITFAQTYAVTHEVSAVSADLKVLVEMYNRGNVPFRVSNLILSAATRFGDTQLPVGNLDLNTFFNNFVPWSLAPGGKQGPVNFVRDNLTLDQAAQLGDMSGLVLTVGVYELTDANNRPYVFADPVIRARTATMDIDFGGKRPHERHLVATNLDPAHQGVTMRRALEDILRIPYLSDSQRGLLSVRNVDTPDPGRWTVELRHTDDDKEEINAYAPPYEFGDILLRAGDVVHLSWSTP